jgi:hypothetical protein
VYVFYHSSVTKNFCEILYVSESEDAEEDEYESDTLDSHSELRSTISDNSRKFQPSVEIKDTT